MFGNLAKRMATRSYLLFMEASFTYVPGERLPKIDISTFDLTGRKVGNVEWNKITDDYVFLVGGCGNYILVWIAQLIDSAVGRRDNSFITKIFRLEDAFNASGDALGFSQCYSLIDPKIQSLVIANRAKVQFLIHPVSRGLLVSTMNTPLASGDECDYLLLLLFIEFVGRQYSPSTKVIKSMGRDLFCQFKADPDVTRHPAALRAHDIGAKYLEKSIGEVW